MTLDFRKLPRAALKKLSRAVSKKDASELLHSMATSKGIQFWALKGEMLTHKKRRIPVTSIAKFEYILLPYNPDVAKPIALNTFLDGLAKTAGEKQKLLADLVLREYEMPTT